MMGLHWAFLHAAWDLSFTRNGANYVGEDFMLATAADIVADPSVLQTLSSRVLWKEENGYGTTDS